MHFDAEAKPLPVAPSRPHAVVSGPSPFVQMVQYLMLAIVALAALGLVAFMWRMATEPLPMPAAISPPPIATAFSVTPVSPSPSPGPMAVYVVEMSPTPEPTPLPATATAEAQKTATAEARATATWEARPKPCPSTGQAFARLPEGTVCVGVTPTLAVPIATEIPRCGTPIPGDECIVSKEF